MRVIAYCAWRLSDQIETIKKSLATTRRKRAREIDQRPWFGVDSWGFFAEFPTNLPPTTDAHVGEWG